jgi:hypothetical protein
MLKMDMNIIFHLPFSVKSFISRQDISTCKAQAMLGIFLGTLFVIFIRYMLRPISYVPKICLLLFF